MDKIDVLVKGCPVPIHNMFKGFCSMHGKSISEGLIDLMIEAIERTNGANSSSLQTIVDEYRGRAGKK